MLSASAPKESYERNIICEHNDIPNNKKVRVNLYLTHKAALRKTPTVEGFTHDWKVSLKGDDGVNIQNFIEKVVFKLHPTFPSPKRGCKSAPYQVIESGYGGFTMPIDVYLKNIGEPQKIRFLYVLYLGVTPRVSHCRCETITFQNPSNSFLEYLLVSGAKLVDDATPKTLTPPLSETSFHSSLKRPIAEKRACSYDDDSDVIELAPPFKKPIQRQINQIFPTTTNPWRVAAAQKKIEPIMGATVKKRGRPRKVQPPRNNDKASFENVDITNYNAINNHCNTISAANPPKMTFPHMTTDERFHSVNNSSLNMSSFIRNIPTDPTRISTPINGRSILKTGNQKKSNLKLRFKSFVEEFSLSDEEKIILDDNLEDYRKRLKEPIKPVSSGADGSKHGRLAPLKDNCEPLPTNSNQINLLELQKTLMSISDRRVLKKIGKILQQSGKLEMEEETINFDLCSLDASTLLKICSCLQS